ncbi:hypothetical protein D3C76_1519320 [compost metagenome]
MEGLCNRSKLQRNSLVDTFHDIRNVLHVDAGVLNIRVIERFSDDVFTMALSSQVCAQGVAKAVGVQMSDCSSSFTDNCNHFFDFGHYIGDLDHTGVQIIS